jgi:hypothetical protein
MKASRDAYLIDEEYVGIARRRGQADLPAGPLLSLNANYE